MVVVACTQDSPGIEDIEGYPIECALHGADSFDANCLLVENQAVDGPVFSVHHPDGGFRRLDLADTPAGFMEGDGSFTGNSYREGEYVVLKIDNDRYRWREPSRE